MAETVLENEICNACQAEVRPDSLFCYNCGESVTAENIQKPEKDFPDDETSSEEIPIKKPDSVELIKNVEEEDETALEISKSEDEKNEDVKESEPDSDKNAKLQSAASLKKRGEKFRKKEVIVTWEEHENAPNVWFMGIAVLLTLFAIGVFFTAMYLR